ncbi:response regulator transcription factor [Streptomyces sp. NPDC093109]|uniref:response regulator transcription factor n=1 Tax=Streptomyces sp. NPDC093109 TaxID=3154977 RepID=UPI00344B6D21
MSERFPRDTARVTIHAPDHIIRAGLVSYLQRDLRVREVPLEKIQEADVVVVAVDVVDASALDLLRSLSGTLDTRFVMVTGKQWQADITAAVDCGVRAVLWRDDFSVTVFIRTLLAIADGGGSFPPALQDTLMEQALAPRGPAASVSDREVDVLRLVAEGRELAEIAAKLSCSERTVKYTLHGLMKRLRLRNRAHAVSHAIRNGII